MSTSNHLLLWLSARRAGSWQQFRGAVEELHLLQSSRADGDDVGSEPITGLPLYQRLRLNLQRLGHVEFFTQGCESGWRVVPPVLAASRVREGWAGILCGARSAPLLKLFRAAAGADGLQPEETTQDVAPDAIVVIAELASLQRMAAAARVYLQIEAPTAILTALSPIDDPQLLSPREFPFGDGWSISRFSMTDLVWRPAAREDLTRCRLGLYRFVYHHRREYVLCREGQAFRVPLQIGKYLLLKGRRRRRGVLRHDADSQTLRVDATFQPPRLVDRALCLCSGHAPSYDPGTHTLWYEGVSRDTAYLAARLLRQELA
jgi:hypothetical protein